MDKLKQSHSDLSPSEIGIIVTRPKGQGLWLIEKINQSGMQAFSLPGFTIEPTTHTAEIDQAKAQIPQYDYLLFTSPNAVKYASYFEIPFDKIKGYIALGRGTERALRSFVTQRKIITAPKPYTSEALIALLKKKRLVKNRSILIMSGEGGRRLLAKAVINLGGKAQYCDLYCRKAPVNTDLSAITAFKNTQNNTDRQLYLVISSQEAFYNLLPEITQNNVRSSINGVFVASDRLQNIVKSEGFENIIVAKSALESDLWQAIEMQLLSQTPNLDSPLTISSDNDKELSMTKKEQKQNKNRATENKVATSSENSAAITTNAAETENAVLIDDANTPEMAAKATQKTEDVVDTVAQDEATSNDNRDIKEALTQENISDAKDENFDDKDQGSTPPPIAPQATTHTSSSGGKVVGYIALLVALAAAGVSGFTYYQSTLGKDDQLTGLKSSLQSSQNDVQTLTANFSKLQSELNTLKSAANKAASTQTADDSVQGQVTLLAQKYDSLNDALAQSAKGLQGQLDSLKTEQQALEEKATQIDNIAKVSDQAITIANSFDKKLAEQDLKQAVVLDEAKELITTIKSITDLELLRTTEVDYLLKIAVQKVEYDRDYKGAADLLTTAIDRLGQINSINFTETKQLLESNIADLKALNPVDMMMITERLEKVVSLVQHAPLKSDSALVNLKKEIFDQPTDEGNSWGDKLHNSLKHLIVIEDKRADVPELMAKEDRFFLVQNIQLELTSAKIAAQQDQFDLFDHSLDTVKSWITTYFDEDNADVREALKQLQWMLDAKFDTTPPNIQRTLTDFEATLRAYKGA